MSESDLKCESDDDSWCYSTDASDHSDVPPISSSDDMQYPSLTSSSGGGSPLTSISDGSDAEMMDIDENDADDDDSSHISKTSTPPEETEDEIDEPEVVEINHGDDIVEPTKDAPCQLPPKFDRSMSMLSTFCATMDSTEEETAAQSQPSSSLDRHRSMFSSFSPTYTEEEIVTPSCSSESNGEENASSSSIKNHLPSNIYTHRLCFNNGVQVDRILEAVFYNGQLLFRVRWRNDKNGGTDYVNAFEMHEKCPHMALQFYQEHYKNKNIDKTDK